MTSCPADTSAAPTAAPIAPGCNTPTVVILADQSREPGEHLPLLALVRLVFASSWCGERLSNQFQSGMLRYGLAMTARDWPRVSHRVVVCVHAGTPERSPPSSGDGWSENPYPTAAGAPVVRLGSVPVVTRRGRRDLGFRWARW
jgi:hypothetical protein